MVHASCRQICSHLSTTGVQYMLSMKPGAGSYLNGLPLNLIRPASVVSQACNNTNDITISRLSVDLT